MNTADRSARSIDVALRRRFDLFECLPDRRILERYYGRAVNQVSDLFDGFDTLNGRLEDLPIEGVEPVGVARERRDVVDPVQQHGSSLTSRP